MGKDFLLAAETGTVGMIALSKPGVGALTCQHLVGGAGCLEQAGAQGAEPSRWHAPPVVHRLFAQIRRILQTIICEVVEIARGSMVIGGA
jgi:hypothetical protein